MKRWFNRLYWWWRARRYWPREQHPSYFSSQHSRRTNGD